MWEWAMYHWLYNEMRRMRDMRRTIINDKNELEIVTRNTTPFKEAHGSEPEVTYLVPFGTACSFLDDTVTRGEKFRDRSVLGAIVGYGAPGTYKVVDVAKVGESGKISVIHTRGVRIIKGRFPLRNYKFATNYKVEIEDPEEEVPRCEKCGKHTVMEGEIATCDGCVQNAQAKDGSHANN